MNKDDKKTVEDQELADMIASMKGGTGQPAAKLAPGMQPNPAQDFKVPTPPPKPPVSPTPAPNPNPGLPPVPPPPADGHLPVGHDPIKPSPKPPKAPTPPVPPVPPKAPSTPGGPGSDPELAHIKRDAIQALRPLVNELDLPAEEKFNTLLLLIRSTDDKSLIQPAYEAVQQITDDTKKAQALLDIVKEIDFFENLNK